MLITHKSTFTPEDGREGKSMTRIFAVNEDGEWTVDLIELAPGEAHYELVDCPKHLIGEKDPRPMRWWKPGLKELTVENLEQCVKVWKIALRIRRGGAFEVQLNGILRSEKRRQ